jgi:hypothetical protein
MNRIHRRLVGTDDSSLRAWFIYGGRSTRAGAVLVLASSITITAVLLIGMDLIVDKKHVYYSGMVSW